MVSDSFLQSYEPGQSVDALLHTRPLVENCDDRFEGLSFFEGADGDGGAEFFETVVAEAKKVLLASDEAREGGELTFRGARLHWQRPRQESLALEWGRYFPSNKLITVFLGATLLRDTEVAPPALEFQPAQRPCRILVAGGKELLYDSGPGGGQMPTQPHLIELPAGSGPLPLRIALLRLGKHTRAGGKFAFRTKCAVLRTPPTNAVPPEVGAAFAEALAAWHPINTHIAENESVHWQGPSLALEPGLRVARHIRGMTASEPIVSGESPPPEGKLDFPEAKEVASGTYEAEAVFYSAAGRELGRLAFPFAKRRLLPDLAEDAGLEARKRALLEQCASSDRYRNGSLSAIWPELAKFALGRHGDLDEEPVRRTCAHINAQRDCSDFVMQGILRLLYLDRGVGGKLPAELAGLMRRTVLDFRYWLDEPGKSMMAFGSENHRMLFHTAEFLGGLLYPDERFTLSGEKGLFHIQRARFHLHDWLRHKGRFGFEEWLSSHYFPVDAAGLVNLLDLSPTQDAEIKRLAEANLDALFCYLAGESFQGYLLTAHGRNYSSNLLDPVGERTGPLYWLLFGGRPASIDPEPMGATLLAASRYAPPPVLSRIADDTTRTGETRMRQVVPGGRSRDASANVSGFRTPCFQLSAAQDHRPGMRTAGTIPARIGLPGALSVFWSCPDTPMHGIGFRPDYWAGNAVMPRVVHTGPLMALGWSDTGPWQRTHCFFDQAAFDEVLEHAPHWMFGRKDSALLAIYSQHPFEVPQGGLYARREILCKAAANFWLAECASANDWKNLSAFADAFRNGRTAVRQGTLTHQSPARGEFVFPLAGTPTLRGEEIATRGYPLMDAPWARADFGVGIWNIRHAGEETELYFQ